MSNLSAIQFLPEINGGQPVFFGTRIPVELFFDHLRIGFSACDFLREFPSVTSEQTDEVLNLVRDPKSGFAQLVGSKNLAVPHAAS